MITAMPKDHSLLHKITQTYKIVYVRDFLFFSSSGNKTEKKIIDFQIITDKIIFFSNGINRMRGCLVSFFML